MPTGKVLHHHIEGEVVRECDVSVIIKGNGSLSAAQTNKINLDTLVSQQQSKLSS